jgi:hypothetical protein
VNSRTFNRLALFLFVGSAAALFLTLRGPVSYMSSDLSPAVRGFPVNLLLVNETPDTLGITLRTRGGEVFERRVRPPGPGTSCERFEVHVNPGQAYTTQIEITNLRSGQRDTSLWFEINKGFVARPDWIDTVRTQGRHQVIRLPDASALGRAGC